ncbi:endolytic transglycosylase MltG [Microbacterium sp. ARD32]|uniref:endolytic transglycosylase MltG n=1 Tax=Microbacterium sp. ARD32 TaxID=2962577 RepID=UPI002881105C|nr:endolytic transglycosylase MltG [Microbacterium sp. ARD32]MDT0157205.1 endolytic transglycosylase MltG [Microbacterium sp. ARD32]
MPDPDASSGLGDLFENLPTAASGLPERAQRDAPPPGSRRAMREARAAADRSADEVVPPQPAEAPEPTAPSPSEAAQESSSMEDLFAPEQHREVPRKRGRGRLIGLIIVLVVLGGIAAGGAWVYNTYQDKINEMMGWGEPKDYASGEATGEVQVTIMKGDTGSPVSTALFKAGVTKTDRVFYDYLIKEKPTATFYPGVYKLQKRMTAEAALKALEDPENRMANTVRIAEGGTIESSLPRIVDGVGLALEDLQAAVKDPAAYGVQAASLEGWLFPATYTFDPGATATDVIQRMVDRTRESLSKAGVPDADAQRVLTIASIIEREARTPDFTKVSRVIQNRLDDGMKLQMDSTAQYGYGELHAGKASTSKEAQHAENDWNTYAITGLPATPISNPGDAAIDAAMHPADGTWLYFVTVNMSTGQTVFSDTYAEHQQAIKQMRSWCRANPDTGC